MDSKRSQVYGTKSNMKTPLKLKPDQSEDQGSSGGESIQRQSWKGTHTHPAMLSLMDLRWTKWWHSLGPAPPTMLSVTDLRWTNWWHSFGPTQTILSLIDLHTSEPVSSGLDLLIIPPEIMTKSKSPILSLLSFAIKINHIYTSEDLTSVGCPEDSCRHWLQLMGTGQWSKLSPVDNIGDSCGQVWPWTSCYLYNCTYD